MVGWSAACRYAANAGFEIAWDINALRMRTAANTWNDTFAADMLRYVAARPQQAAVLRFVQLGNEPVCMFPLLCVMCSVRSVLCALCALYSVLCVLSALCSVRAAVCYLSLSVLIA